MKVKSDAIFSMTRNHTPHVGRHRDERKKPLIIVDRERESISSLSDTEILHFKTFSRCHVVVVVDLKSPTKSGRVFPLSRLFKTLYFQSFIYFQARSLKNQESLEIADPEVSRRRKTAAFNIRIYFLGSSLA